MSTSCDLSCWSITSQGLDAQSENFTVTAAQLNIPKVPRPDRQQAGEEAGLHDA